MDQYSGCFVDFYKACDNLPTYAEHMGLLKLQ